MAKRKATPKQLRFVEEYLIDLNAEGAAKRAGYHPAYSRELLRKPSVKKAVAERQKAALKTVGLTPERVVEQMGRLAFADIREAFDENGSLKDLKDIPPELASAIAGIEIKETKTKGTVVKIRFEPKSRALEQLGKHFKLFTEVHEIRGVEDLVRRLLEARRRVAGRA